MRPFNLDELLMFATRIEGSQPITKLVCGITTPCHFLGYLGQVLLNHVLRNFPHESSWGDMLYLFMPSVHCKRLWAYLCALDEPIIPADFTSISDGNAFNKGANESGDRSNWLYRLKLVLDVSTVQLTVHVFPAAETRTHKRD